MEVFIHNIVESEIYKDIRNIVEFLSFVATFIGIIAIYISLRQLKNEQAKEFKEREKQKAEVEYKRAEKSIELLSIFANEVIPKMDEFTKKYNDELSSQKGELQKQTDEKKQLIMKLLKYECRVGDIFNKLEHICLYVEADLVNEEIILDPLSPVLIEFMEENKEIFEDLKTRAPYKYLTMVYQRWTDKRKIKTLDQQEQSIHKEKAKIQERLDKSI